MLLARCAGATLSVLSELARRDADRLDLAFLWASPLVYLDEGGKLPQLRSFTHTLHLVARWLRCLSQPSPVMCRLKETEEFSQLLEGLRRQNK